MAAVFASGQANGKLQIHYMDVDQGDGAVLISPFGEVLLFDNGFNQCTQRSVVYLEKIGITHIDYMIISHYHKDHFGCTKAVLSRFPTPACDAYVEAVGNKRKRFRVGQDDRMRIS